MARGYRRKRSYSTLRRILIHLSTGGDPSRPTLLPYLTQEGIGAATYSGRSTATKWLMRLQSEGLVVGDREHVPGHRVRKTVYRLTEAGWGEARRVRKRLESEIVTVRMPRLDGVTMRVAQIPDLFPALLDLTATVSLVREGRLDLTRLPEARTAAIPSVLWGESLRRVDRVLGRTEEFKALGEWLTSPTPVLVVTGLPGMGKTTLVASWVLRQRPRTHVFWSELREWTSPSVFLGEFGAFTARLGRRSLSGYLDDAGKLDLGVVARVLAHDLRDLPILMVVDNVHKASAETARFLANLVLRLGQTTKTKTILISRAVPSGLPRRPGRKAIAARILRVGGLTLDASVSLLKLKGLAADDVTTMKVAASTKGHPLLLSLAAQSGSAVGAEARRFIEDEIWRGLSLPERESLQVASVFRRAAPIEALRRFPGTTDLAIVGLETKNIVEPTMGGGLVVHDIVRDYVRERMSEGRRRVLHGFAADYFLTQSDPRDRLEVLYQLIQADRVTEAADFLVAERTSLVESSSAREVASLLDGLDLSSLSPGPASILAEVLGDCLRISGHVAPALLQYQHAIRRCTAGGNEQFVPRLLRKIASIERYRNDYAKALGLLVEAQARLSRTRDPAELAEVLREMALVEEAQGNAPAAQGHLNESIDIATEASDEGSLARSLLVLGTLEMERGNKERALDHKLESLRIATRSGNLTELSRANISVGATCHEMRRLREALRYYEEGLQLAQIVGNLRLSAYATMNRAAALIDLEAYVEAAGPLEDARGLLEILEERDTLALLDVAAGQCEMGLGNWTRATRVWSRAISGLRNSGTPYDLLRSLKLIGGFHVDRGRPEEGHAYLREALAMARRMGNARVVAELEARLDRIVTRRKT